MATVTLNGVVHIMRHDTAANWSSVNPILANSELGYETDTKKAKMGDGVTTWNNLEYYIMPRARITATVAAAAYYAVAETDINPDEFAAELKITVTSSTNAAIRHTLIAHIVGNGLAVPYASIDSAIGSSSAVNSGIAYMRVLYPKTMDNGYKAVIEIYAYDATSRDITVELLESKNIHLTSAIAVTTYNSTYQSAYTTGALYYSAKISSVMYASITGSAGSSSYSSYGVLGGVTVSNTNDKTGLWEYFGNWLITYHSTYLKGRSGNIAIRLRELNFDGSKNLDELDDFVVKIKFGLASYTDTATFDATIPTVKISIDGRTSLTENDFAALVYTASTANKYLRFYIKLKGPNTVYTIEPDARYGRDYSNTNAQTTSYNYFSYASEQTPIAALPTPAQGEIVYATKDKRSFNVTLTAAGWTGTAAPYTQTISVTGILASMRTMASVALSTIPDTALAEVDAFLLVHRLTPSDGSIVVTCYGNKPAIDLNIRIEEV